MKPFFSGDKHYLSRTSHHQQPTRALDRSYHFLLESMQGHSAGFSFLTDGQFLVSTPEY